MISLNNKNSFFKNYPSFTYWLYIYNKFDLIKKSFFNPVGIF